MKLQVVLMRTLYAEEVSLFQPDCCKQSIPRAYAPGPDPLALRAEYCPISHLIRLKNLPILWQRVGE